MGARKSGQRRSARAGGRRRISGRRGSTGAREDLLDYDNCRCQHRFRPRDKRRGEEDRLTLGEKIGFVVGRVVVMVRIGVVIGCGSRAVVVAVMVSVRLGVIVGRLGVTMGSSEEMNRKPSDM